VDPPLALEPPVLPLGPGLLAQADRTPTAPSPINASCLNRLFKISNCLSFSLRKYCIRRGTRVGAI